MRPTPIPGTNPTILHPTVVPRTIAHSYHNMCFVDVHSASSTSSMPMNKTRVDASIVGTYGRMREEGNIKAKVVSMTRNASARWPEARAKNLVLE